MDNTKIINTVEHKLNTHLSPQHLEVTDFSHLHAKHKEAQEHGGAHLKVTIVSDRFMPLNTVQRHKLIYRILEKEMVADIHALKLKTLTPADWRELQKPADEETLQESSEISDNNSENEESDKPLPSLNQVEAAYIQKILNYSQGHLGKACSILGLNRPRLTRKIEKYDLTIPKKNVVPFNLEKDKTEQSA